MFFTVSSLLRKPPRGFCSCSIKHISGNPRIKIVPEVDGDVINGFENKTMTINRHPGKLSRQLAEFDDKMIDTIKILLKDTHVKKLLVDAKNLCTYLHSRQPPISKLDYQEQKRQSSQKVMEQMNIDPSQLSEEKYADVEKVFSKKVQAMVKQQVYNWQPVDYTTYVGKQYLVDRMIAEYSALKRIFSEIALRDPEFQPTTLFDFGSGVGTVTWAVRKQWPNSLKECYNVDSSAEMNEIAELLLKDGDPQAPLPIPSVFYRQFLNVDSERKYNLVISSYSLLDLPSQEIRLKTLSNLWNKTEDFLVLVERGTKAGFHVINEARDYLLEAETVNEASSGIHIFSPCTHEQSCPQKRYTDKPCCFKANYMLPPIGRRQTIERELYSFVVFRKGERLESEKQWPRVLKKAFKKKKTVRCRMCCPDGKLRILTCTKKKHGRDVVQLLRKCHSCDRFPVTLREVDMNFKTDHDVTEISSAEDFDNDSGDDDDDDDESDPQN